MLTLWILEKKNEDTLDVPKKISQHRGIKNLILWHLFGIIQGRFTKEIMLSKTLAGGTQQNCMN